MDQTEAKTAKARVVAGSQEPSFDSQQPSAIKQNVQGHIDELSPIKVDQTAMQRDTPANEDYSMDQYDSFAISPVKVQPDT